jgi:hypothetical protein
MTRGHAQVLLAGAVLVLGAGPVVIGLAGHPSPVNGPSTVSGRLPDAGGPVPCDEAEPMDRGGVSGEVGGAGSGGQVADGVQVVAGHRVAQDVVGEFAAGGPGGGPGIRR